MKQNLFIFFVIMMYKCIEKYLNSVVDYSSITRAYTIIYFKF